FVEVSAAFRAMRGRKDHGLGFIRQSENDDIEERADQGAENKAVEKEESFHVYVEVMLSAAFGE
ncbi:hypothetical protein VU00_12552, partial [Candidatus Electrothrix marina]